MNITLFLGAGFSAPFGMPIMNNFLSFVESDDRINQEDKEFFRELVIEARKANSFLQSRPTNLEDILSFSIMGDRLDLNKENAGERNLKIREILSKVFTRVVDRKNFWTRFDALKTFLGFNPNDRKHILSIITTNYDLCIECAMHRMGIQTYPGFNFSLVRDDNNIFGYHFYHQTGLPLYKLHGSVNWFINSESQDNFNVECRIVSTLNSGDEKSHDRTLPILCTSNYKSPDVPYIIPPSFLKPDLEGPMGHIWAGAAQSLRDSDIVIFVGYSFPDSDTEMKFFLARALVENAKLRKIIIVDLEADSIAKKLIDPSNRYGSHFREFLEPINGNWTDIKQKLF